MNKELKNYLDNINYEIEISDINLENLDLGLNAKSWKELLNYLENQHKEIERLNNIINEITKMIKDDYFKAYNYTKKIEQSEKPQGDYPVYYYYNLKKKELTDEYLNRIEELKGSEKE